MKYIVSTYPANTDSKNPDSCDFGFQSLHEVEEFIDTIYRYEIGVNKIEILKLEEGFNGE